MSDHSTDRDAQHQAGAPAEADPLRSSWTSKTWTAVAGLGILLILLIVFIAQNTQSVAIRFLGWTWHPPLAVGLLASVAAGLLLAVCAGTLRILQLRRRVRRTKRERKADAKADHQATDADER